MSVQEIATELNVSRQAIYSCLWRNAVN
jgi:predicted DNA-binding protein YlxM (UPF0122 family)